MRLLAIQHDDDAPPALVKTWAVARGHELEVVRAQALPTRASADGLVVLGSDDSVADDTLPWLADELAFVQQAMADGIAVLGICFGAQLLARALGGTVGRAPAPEVGWLEVETLDDEVPAGPWLQWHGDAFTLPPGARLLARSPIGPQAFRLGPHVGVQFHPEVTQAVVAAWARDYPASLERAGTTAERVLDDSERHARETEGMALDLFDAFARGGIGTNGGGGQAAGDSGERQAAAAERNSART